MCKLCCAVPVAWKGTVLLCEARMMLQCILNVRHCQPFQSMCSMCSVCLVSCGRYGCWLYNLLHFMSVLSILSFCGFDSAVVFPEAVNRVGFSVLRPTAFWLAPGPRLWVRLSLCWSCPVCAIVLWGYVSLFGLWWISVGWLVFSLCLPF